MIARLIRLCADNPVLTLVIAAAFALAAAQRMRHQPLDALPDLSDTQVIVFADWPGKSPELIEDQVTYPLTTSLLSTAKVKYVRGVSMLGASQIVVVFEDGTDLYWARSRVAEKLASVQTLPSGVTPGLGPEATGLGWVYQYALVDRTGGKDLAQLRSLQDWQLRFALQSVPGVAEVASVGGFVKEFQVSLDPIKLRAFQVSPLAVVRALRAANQEIGAGVLEMGGSDFAVRGRGYIKSLGDVEKVPVAQLGQGRSVSVGDLGVVQMLPAARAGAVELDGEGEVVSGIVVMRIGANALNVIKAVKERIASLEGGLPPGVEIVPVYDRSDLIERAIATLRTVLVEEILVVALIVALFLWHFRSSLVAILPLPVAVLLSFLPMSFSELTINIMSLGGIALAIGAMVDSGIILVENAHKRLEGLDTATIPDGERRRIIVDAMVEMGRPLFFSLLVITASFLPLFALEGREGRLFSPLAFTKTVSMAWAALLAVTVTPALAVLLLKGKFVAEDRHPVSRTLQRIYSPVVDFAVRRKALVIGIAVALMLVTLPVALRLPSEFMPPLNEGTILYMPTATPGMSLDSAMTVMQKQNRIIRSLPEVERVFGKAGRAGTATDPAPVNMFETVITLKDPDTWRPGMTYEKIVAELNERLDFPGMPNIWWMPIQTRIEMLSTGVRTALGLKILGPDAASLETAAAAVEAVLKKVPGTRSVLSESIASGSYIDVDVQRDVAASYGLNIADVHSVIETAVGGTVATTVVDGRERFGVAVRYAADFRSDLDALADLIVPTPQGGEVRLGQVAHVRITSGASMINSEAGRMLSLVFVSVDDGVGLSEYVDAARREIKSEVKLPPGVELRWSGQYEALASAKEKLKLVVPLTLALIVFLLYMSTKSMAEVAIVLLAVPFSLVGAVWLMWLLDYKLSIASWVGLLALAGLDAETGVVMLLYLTQAYAAKAKLGPVTAAGLKEAIHEGAVKRVRPKLMTVAAALLGLLPVMWSTGAGSEVMKRIAAPMVGGVVTSGLLELLVYPAVFALWKGRKAR